MGALPRPPARGARGAVACGHPLAAGAAIETFAAGGDAVDAAVAAAYALCILLPESCGLGGDALFTVLDSGGALTSFNGSGRSPSEFTGAVPIDGARTTTVPGLVEALSNAHQRFGTVEMATLIEPAVRIARSGFPAGGALIAAMERQRGRLQRGAGDWEVLNEDPALGGLVRQPTLAGLLERIGADGPAAFYEGEIADAIAASAQREGGELSISDLANHETVIGPPLSAEFRQALIHVQPPVSQAVLGLMALRYLDGLGQEDDRARVHGAIEAIEGAFAHRDLIADPDSVSELLGTALEVDPHRAQLRGEPTAQTHTTAVATADADGNVVSMVLSVFDEFGCATLVPEGGFFLNNRMMGFSSDPSSPNVAAPGKRPLHTLSPKLVETDEVAFGISTPGADGQVQTLAQVIDALIVGGLDYTSALDQRRWRSSDGQLSLEEGFDPEVATFLAEAGHRIRWAPAGSRPFGAVVIAGVDRRGGGAFAAADLRREAWAAAY